MDNFLVSLSPPLKYPFLIQDSYQVQRSGRKCVKKGRGKCFLYGIFSFQILFLVMSDVSSNRIITWKSLLTCTRNTPIYTKN